MKSLSPRKKTTPPVTKIAGRSLLLGVLLVGAIQQWMHYKAKPQAPKTDPEVETITQKANQVTYRPLCKEGYFGTEVFVIRRRLSLTAYSSGRLEPEELIDTFYYKTLSPEEGCPSTFLNDDFTEEESLPDQP